MYRRTANAFFFVLAAGVFVCSAVALQPSGGAADLLVGGDLVHGESSIMSRKAHGTTDAPPQASLRWGSDWKTVSVIQFFATASHQPTSGTTAHDA